MDYIILPSWFYWLGVAEIAHIMSIVLTMLLGVACSVLAILRISMFYDYSEEEPEVKTVKRLQKIVLPLTVLFLILAIFIPSKETLIEMQVAKFATYENAQLTLNAVKNAVDYIISGVKGG